MGNGEGSMGEYDGCEGGTDGEGIDKGECGVGSDDVGCKGRLKVKGLGVTGGDCGLEPKREG